MRPLRIVVVGNITWMPYAGIAWMTMQIAVGLQRLGHDVYLMEVNSSWPYDPLRESHVEDSDYALSYLRRVVEAFGLEGRWAYRRSCFDSWFGLSKATAEDLLLHADAVINVSGATSLDFEGLKIGTLVYLGTDPGEHEVGYFNGNPKICRLIDEHDVVVTWGESVGRLWFRHCMGI